MLKMAIKNSLVESKSNLLAASKSQQSVSTNLKSTQQEDVEISTASGGNQHSSSNSANNGGLSRSLLDEIEEVKTYYPTEEQFAEPMKYIEYLNAVEKASKYGIVKIVPPKSFRPPLAFDQFSKAKLPTRYQVLQDLSQGKPFDQNSEGHTFPDFVAISRELEEGDKCETPEDYWKIEKDYWNMVENQVGPRMRVQYAADLNVKQFGSGFGCKDQNPRLADHRAKQYLDHPWNLSNLCA